LSNGQMSVQTELEWSFWTSSS